MRSIELLPYLERIPLHREHERYTGPEVIECSAKMRNDLFAIEVASGAETAASGLFDARNVSDDLFHAFKFASPDIATDHSLFERYAEMVDRGPNSITSFINNVKGKLFELRLPEQLNSEFPGYSFRIAEAQNQSVWDITGTGPDGTAVLIQAKAGAPAYAADVLTRMQGHPDVLFAATSEIRADILADHPELAGQFVDVDVSNYDLTSDVRRNLDVLAQNHGIDVPDEVGDLLPYVTEIVLGIRLLCDLVKTERDFTAVALEDRARIHGMKALVLFQRFGISTVCTTAGGAAGTAISPGFGTAGGAIVGAALAAYLNKELRPRVMQMAMALMRVTEDDLFYFRNKLAIDRIGKSLADSAVLLLDRAEASTA
jgi:hypothetical protein